jgi:CRISPR/Cas system-associated exonuclease Cas4 (RecB family)
MKNYRLSKSQYTKARRCLKAIYLYHHEEKAADPRSAFTQNILDQGISVGELATKLFPDGNLIDAKYNQLDLALEQTKDAITKNASAIFEATFQYNDVLVRVDILKNNFDGTWNLIEVKSSTSVNPKTHYDDIAIQKWVLENCGIKLNSVNIMLLNSDYIRQGELELDKLFVTIPLDAEIKYSYERVETAIPSIQSVLNKDVAPVVKIGSKCKSPYPCEFKSHCWQDVSAESIHYLGKMTDAEKLKLTELGVEKITEIPDGYKMKTNHHVEVLAFKTMKPQISESAIKEYLGELKYP